MYSRNINSLEMAYNVLPHELMHAYGFSGGIYEGATELFTREIASKYGIEIFPLAHGSEVNDFKNIERILGRDEIAKLLLTNDDLEKGAKLLSDILEKNLEIQMMDIHLKIM